MAFLRGVILIKQNLPKGINYTETSDGIEAIVSIAGKALDLFLTVEPINTRPNSAQNEPCTP